MKKIYLLLVLFFAIQTSFACSCGYLFSEDVDVKELLEDSEIAVVGYPIKNIDDTYVSDNPKYMGTMILFKVESVLKGKLTSDTIFINQQTVGNCSQYFIPNEKYVIFGDQIIQYDTIANNDYHSIADYNRKNKLLKFHDSNNKLTVFENLTKKYVTITTSQCVSFTNQNTKVWKYFNLKK